MYDTRTIIVEKLKTICDNVYYEKSEQSPTLPCITYMVMNNAIDVQSETISYSNTTYRLKIWTTKLSILSELSDELDEVMRGINFERTGYNEITSGDIIQGIFEYTAKLREMY